MTHVLFWLVVGHALADFPLQGDFLARGKDHTTEFGKSWWYVCMPAHAAIHAGAVALATGSIFLGSVEFVAHWMIDFLKCDKRICLAADQILHIVCKVVYAYIITLGIHVV